MDPPMRDTPVVPEHVPLTTLLSWAWIAHTIEVDNAFEAASSDKVGRHFRISLAMFTNGLRSIPAEGISVGELRERTRAACNIGGLERWGWISIGETTGMRRAGYGTGRGIRADTVLRPTRAGLYAQKLWPRMLSAVEERWRSRFGGEVIDTLHEALIAIARPLPWSPPEIAPSDGFWTHVIDGDGAVDDGRPLVALLGQVLTAMTLDHEREAAVSLPLAANVLRVIDAGALRLRDMPARSDLSSEGIAMAAGYLLRNGLATSAPERAIRLTPAGRDALAGLRGSSTTAGLHDVARSAGRSVAADHGALGGTRASRGLLASPDAIRGAESTPRGRPARGAALASDGAASRRLA